MAIATHPPFDEISEQCVAAAGAGSAAPLAAAFSVDLARAATETQATIKARTGVLIDSDQITALACAVRSADAMFERVVGVLDGARIVVSACPVDAGSSHALLSVRLCQARRSAVAALAQRVGVSLSHDEAVTLALTDALTGLANRRAFSALFEATCRRERAAVCLFDVDRFKAVNDELGHAVGDRLLVAIADRLRAWVRADDFLARIAGDEFALLMPGVSDEADCAAIVSRIQCAFAEPVDVGGVTITVSLTAGTALVDPETTSAEAFRRADVSLHMAKRSARGRIRHAEAHGEDLSAHRELRWVEDLLARPSMPIRSEAVTDSDGRTAAVYLSLDHSPCPDGLFASAWRFGRGRAFARAYLRSAMVLAAVSPTAVIHLPSAMLADSALYDEFAAAANAAGLPLAKVNAALSARGDSVQDAATRLSSAGVPLVLSHWDLGLDGLDLLWATPFNAVALQTERLHSCLSASSTRRLALSALEALPPGLPVHALGPLDGEPAQLFQLGVSAFSAIPAAASSRAA